MRGNNKTQILQIVFIMVVFLLANQSPAAEFAGGTGEPNDPYQIATAEQLLSIASMPNLLDKHYVLVNDINLDPNLPGGQVFTRCLIANNTSYGFSGSFDGKGHKIMNLRIHRDTESEVGLFGWINSEGRIQNLAVENFYISMNDLLRRAGGLVGKNNGVVYNCYATGNIYCSRGIDLGGLIGQNNGSITKCYSTVSITATEVYRWYNSNFGGLAGTNSSSGSITNCYAGGSVVGPDGSENIGGLTGRNMGYIDPETNEQFTGRITNCYSTASVVGGDGSSNIGGLVGTNSGYVVASFWDVETSDMQTSSAGVGLTTAEMMNAEVYSLNGWGGDPNWVLDNGKDYPRLAWEGTAGQIIPEPVIDWFEGDGTRENPYIIATAEQLDLIGTASVIWDKNYMLISDLDLSSIDIQPIGNKDIGVSFNGYFEGNKHVIHNLTIDSEGIPLTHFGLFGWIGIEGEVNDLGLENVQIAGSDSSYILGGLAGSNDGTIVNCYITGSIMGGDNSINFGGLVGTNDGWIIDCYSVTNISAGDNSTNLGGFAGSNGNSPIENGCWIINCYSVTNVSGGENSKKIGGFVGKNRGRIIDCNSVADVSGADECEQLGGFVGLHVIGSIINCSTNSNISTGNFNWCVGGLVGSNGYLYKNIYIEPEPGNITNCFAIGSASAGHNSEYFGGLIGLNFGDITNCSVTGNVCADQNSVFIGGLVGCHRYWGSIDNCFSGGSVSSGQSSKYIGGLVGDNSGNITNCYAAADVLSGDGSSYLGGFLGSNWGNTTNCYSIGAVSGSDNTEFIGGLVGENSIYVTDCFWDIEASGISESAEGTGLTTVQMLDIQTYLDAGWDMVGECENGTTDIWQIPEGGGYPELTFLSDDYQPHILEGDGTVEEPYQIATKEDLGAINYYDLSAYYKLVADIDLFDITWRISPITDFDGTFDGNVHRIRNLKIESHKSEYVGLFRKIGINGRIQNLGLENVFITTTVKPIDDPMISVSIFLFGGLAGVNFGEITDCYVTGNISCEEGSEYIAGLVGYNAGSITDCYTDCNVTGNYRLGGLVGLNEGMVSNSNTSGSVICVEDGGGLGGLIGSNYGNISNCLSTCNVSVLNHTHSTAGLVGYNDYEIINCFATGHVSGGESSYNLGGLVGTSQGDISYCYATGNVSGGEENRNIGGLVGDNGSGGMFSSGGGRITDCYSTGTVSSGDGSYRIGGLIGLNYYSDASNCYATGKVTCGNNCNDLGKLVGNSRGDSMIDNCYFLIDPDGDELLNDFGVPLTNEQMKQQASFVDWDFDDIWMICEGIDYPRLQFQDIQCGE